MNMHIGVSVGVYTYVSACKWRVLEGNDKDIVNTTQYNTMQYNTIQYNTIQYNTMQYNTIQYNTIQYNTIQYNTIQYDTIRYNTMQYTTPHHTTMHHIKSLSTFKRHVVHTWFIEALFTSCVVWTKDLNSTTHPLTMLKKAVANWGSPEVKKRWRYG